ncbi:unnamed protein product [Vicia faba]|uniref:Uncharacterized protein n=1 Tax=Vicia faba TaxID=3906 RepID=A0AAV0YNZ3_VICFA|nr:unnamed protein product [Vicia faba]
MRWPRKKKYGGPDKHEVAGMKINGEGDVLDGGAIPKSSDLKSFTLSCSSGNSDEQGFYDDNIGARSGAKKCSGVTFKLKRGNSFSSSAFENSSISEGFFVKGKMMTVLD